MKNNRSNQYFPIFIDLNHKKCLVFGGGAIGTRRVKRLLEFGARVTVYAPKISCDIRAMEKEYPHRLILCEQPYCPGIREADFVFSCVDSRETDLQIYRECKEKGIPVNIASDQKLCDFYFPALVEAEDMVIGISSGGKDHKKVRQLAQRLRRWIGEQEWK